jgi:M6 family metalloprotease-like protein
MRTTHIKFLLPIILIYQAITINAIPAFPDLATVKQPDGSTISLYLKGDEKVHWMESEDGYSLMYNNNKAIVYAITDEKGDMMPSLVLARDISMRSSSDNAFLNNIQKKLRYSSNQINTLRSIWEATSDFSNASSNRFRAAVGDAHAICALVSFANKPLIKSKADFEVLMNQEGYSANGARGSVVDFYKENSYGKLDFKITVAGPYTLSKNWEYYGENSPGGGSDYIERVQEFAKEAANLTFKDPEINPADYDNDNDGFIDSFHIIFAGFGEEVSGSDPNCIWSHKFEFSPISFGNKKVNVYSCSPELRGNSGTHITNIGVICHELCHVFGAPDFYDANSEIDGEFLGTGN